MIAAAEGDEVGEEETSSASKDKRAADGKIESSAKRPKQALGKGRGKDTDNQMTSEDEHINNVDGEGSATRDDEEKTQMQETTGRTRILTGG